MTSQARSAEEGFVRQFASRLGVHWVIKAVGLTLGITAFFAAYFRVLNHPFFPLTIMPLTGVDRLIGFQPWTLPLYLSLWVYVPLAFVLLRTRREMLRCGVAALLLSVSGLAIFLLWPTAVPALAINWAAHPSFAFLKSVDASGNACPSLHVAFAVFTAVRLGPIWRELGASVAVRAGSWLWCAGIVFSTMATGQHVAVDALAGAVLGMGVAVAFRQKGREVTWSRLA